MIKHLLLISSTKELIKESFWLYALVITFYLLFFVAIGSFLNVLIYRLPKKMSIIKKSSHCPLCGYKIKWYENIPIFSYLFLRGRCHHCQEKINIRYVIVEVLGLLVAIVSLIRFDLSYKCCADYNMMMQIYKSGGRFLSLNIPIAVYDTLGFSEIHWKRVFYEEARICEVENSVYYKIVLYKRIIFRCVRKCLGLR